MSLHNYGKYSRSKMNQAVNVWNVMDVLVIIWLLVLCYLLEIVFFFMQRHQQRSFLRDVMSLRLMLMLINTSAKLQIVSIATKWCLFSINRFFNMQDLLLRDETLGLEFFLFWLNQSRLSRLRLSTGKQTRLTEMHQFFFNFPIFINI